MNLEKLKIIGKKPLKGEVHISRAKNTYLPILAAVLLAEKPVLLRDLPVLRDVNTMKKLLSMLGVVMTEKEEGIVFDASHISHREATYDLVKTMRASILVLGPLLTRFGSAKVSLPGGCAIGARPIDIHLKHLEEMGAIIEIKAGYVSAHAPNGLHGGEHHLSFASVGATENLMCAAALAKGTTVLHNAAREPEIEDLGHFLNALGAKVSGHGTSVITIEGVTSLGGTDYLAIGDRIEAATYVIAGLMTSSHISVKGFQAQHLQAVWDVLRESGANLKEIEQGKNGIEVFPSELKGFRVKTAVYPGIPTDVQAQLVSLACVCEGKSFISEAIFENRFMHVPELHRLGASIELDGATAIIEGKVPLIGAPVMCTDLRASAALVLAGLAAEGETIIDRIYHLDRGYEFLDKKFANLGAHIERIR
jgi:UDP-N-acetylglucosamine 1-carboxyvinyltransferase